MRTTVTIDDELYGSALALADPGYGRFIDGVLSVQVLGGELRLEQGLIDTARLAVELGGDTGSDEVRTLVVGPGATSGRQRRDRRTGSGSALHGYSGHRAPWRSGSAGRYRHAAGPSSTPASSRGRRDACAGRRGRRRTCP